MHARTDRRSPTPLCTPGGYNIPSQLHQVCVFVECRQRLLALAGLLRHKLLKQGGRQVSRVGMGGMDWKGMGGMDWKGVGGMEWKGMEWVGRNG